MAPLFQRGEINGINLPWPLFSKEGKLIWKNKISPGPSFSKRGN